MTPRGSRLDSNGVATRGRRTWPVTEGVVDSAGSVQWKPVCVIPSGPSTSWRTMSSYGMPAAVAMICPSARYPMLL